MDRVKRRASKSGPFKSGASDIGRISNLGRNVCVFGQELQMQHK